MIPPGFGLIGLLIVIAIIALLAGGSFYISKLKEQASIQKIGIDAEKQAQELKRSIEEKEKNLLRLAQ